MKLGIGGKIAVCFIVPVLAMGAIGFWTYRVSGKVLDNAIQTKDDSMVFAMLAQGMKQDVIQVQQWLTDISATRGQDGLNDGFDKAKEKADSFLNGLDRFRKKYVADNDTASLAEVEGIKTSFDAYYKMGVEMAHGYVNSGPPAGNKLMGEFDKTAEELAGKLDPFISEQVAQAEAQMNNITSDINGLKKGTVILFVISAAVISVLSIVLSKMITRPVHNTVEVVKQIAAGDFTREVSVDTDDEIGELGGSVNAMVGDLRSMFVRIAENSDVLASSSKKLADVSSSLSASSEIIASQANGVAGATEQMSMNINSMASGVEEASVNAATVSSTAEEMSANMRSIASAIEEMSITIREVAKNSEDTAKVAGQAMKMSGTATDTMTALGQAANEIGKVTDMIKRIAEQTNLLALNATIEAASAGDAGKGFAVVANEIKELANQSARAAEDIAAKIEGIQASTHHAVQVITDVSGIIGKINSSVSTITNAVHQQTAAANEISKNVVEVTAGANNIASSIAEVAKGAGDIARNAGEAAKGAKEVAANIANINTGINDNSAGIHQVNQSSRELEKIASELHGAVAKFKVNGDGPVVLGIAAYGRKGGAKGKLGTGEARVNPEKREG